MLAPPGPELAGRTAAAGGLDLFSDRTEEAGLDFVHVNGMTGRRYILEIIGPGGALFDYDNDGDLDLYLVQGTSLGQRAGDTSAAGRPLGDRLYRNDLRAGLGGAREPHFVDVTAEAGVGGAAYGMGVATGDIDNDGWVDLYLTRYGPNRLLRNHHDGTFTDVTGAAGVGDPSWSTSASFLDLDRDGWLDLFVANYLDFTFENHVQCRTASSRVDYCGPDRFRGVADRLFRNRGDGTFEDVSSRLGSKPDKALGVVAADFDGDGWTDLYVANDGEPNYLGVNRQGRRFEDEGLLAGAAVNRDGRSEGSMGVDAGDFDGDGDDDLFMTHLTNEKNTLYLNLHAETGELVFEDRSFETGLGAPSLPSTGFGTLWTDYDNDGRLDLPVLNGAVFTIEKQADAGDPYPLRQKPQLFHNVDGRRFADVSPQAGPAFQREAVGRGLVVGDVDNDGDSDLVVVNSNGPARLLINETGQDRSWIGFRLTGAGEGRDMLGARIGVALPDGRTLWRRVHADGGYLSAHDPRVIVGLGDAREIRAVSVRWPDGRSEEWGPMRVGQYHTLRAGTGRAAP